VAPGFLADRLSQPSRHRQLVGCRRQRHERAAEGRATLEYVDWFNHRRLYEHCGGIPPAELGHSATSPLPVLR